MEGGRLRAEYERYMEVARRDISNEVEWFDQHGEGSECDLSPPYAVPALGGSLDAIDEVFNAPGPSKPRMSEPVRTGRWVRGVPDRAMGDLDQLYFSYVSPKRGPSPAPPPYDDVLSAVSQSSSPSLRAYAD
jgi:hypothetical protein